MEVPQQIQASDEEAIKQPSVFEALTGRVVSTIQSPTGYVAVLFIVLIILGARIKRKVV